MFGRQRHKPLIGDMSLGSFCLFLTARLRSRQVGSLSLGRMR